ncbi:MAG: hypothetical protein JWQ11_645 [Rhizobacter sp.]|nr:hypothetical protein [Rhizobacter sp.]
MKQLARALALGAFASLVAGTVFGQTAASTLGGSVVDGGASNGGTASEGNGSKTSLFGGRGKMLLTSGVSSIDGAAGGGISPWAVMGTYAEDGEIGATASFSTLRTQNYRLTTVGVALGVNDRYEVSFAQQRFDASVVAPDTTLRLNIVGVKLKLMGDAVLDSDSWLPQLAAGAEIKGLDPGSAVGSVLDSVAAKRSGVDYYLSASKLFMAQGVLVNGTLRLTKANQNGLLGFGSAADNRYQLKPEASVAWLLQRDLVVGAEIRFKPNNLAFAGDGFRENSWKDLFIAWAPSKRLSLTAAWVDLGNVVGHSHETGPYVSAQIGF